MMAKVRNGFILICLIAGFSTTLLAQDSAASLYNEGLAKLKVKDYDGALPLLQKAIEIGDPESEDDAQVIRLASKNGAIAAYYVGNNLRKANKNDEALAVYDQGIEYDPSFYANYIGRAQAFEGKGDAVDAVKAYLAASVASEKGGKADRAEELYKKADNFAAVAWGKKQWDVAIACAQAFLEERESADAHYYLAQSLKAKGQNSEALTHAQKAAELTTDTDKDKYYFGLAEIHEALGQKSEAVAAYKMVKGATYGKRAEYKVSQLDGSK
ncbi:MAG TPA: tetratricopeptide repeat protein [Saprospiraceae bacterium]|nr:tetratricopeptide repeat protein [Saprospiraceae bacterium]